MREPMRSSRICALQHHLLKIPAAMADKRYRGAPQMRPAVQLLAIALTTSALTASLASAQTLGEVTAATGINSTLQRQGVGSSTSALGTAKRSLASSTKPRNYDDFGGGSTKKSGAKPASGTRNKMAMRSTEVVVARGSWVAGATHSKGSASTAWAKGAAGWVEGGTKDNGAWASGSQGWDASGKGR
jgi:hypothetical protein